MLGLVFLLGAPADTVSAEVVDAACLADDVEIAVIEVGVPEPALAQASDVCDRTEIVAPAPVLAGVFRPPRHAAG